jgi:L-ribulokinase
VTFGWNLNHTAADELFAAIEGTALHTRIVLERMAEHGVKIERVIHTGGIAQKNDVLNQVYANVLGVPVLVPERPITSLGSSIFAFLAAGVFDTIEEAQARLCPPHRTVHPQADERDTYEQLYAMYKPLYFAMGEAASPAIRVGGVLPELRRIAARRQR